MWSERYSQFLRPFSRLRYVLAKDARLTAMNAPQQVAWTHISDRYRGSMNWRDTRVRCAGKRRPIIGNRKPQITMAPLPRRLVVDLPTSQRRSSSYPESVVANLHAGCRTRYRDDQSTRSHNCLDMHVLLKATRKCLYSDPPHATPDCGVRLRTARGR